MIRSKSSPCSPSELEEKGPVGSCLTVLLLFLPGRGAAEGAAGLAAALAEDAIRTGILLRSLLFSMASSHRITEVREDLPERDPLQYFLKDSPPHRNSSMTIFT
ncbi:MAG TPA: hypothetical protein VFG09_05135 [Thermodesulfovibrionales bacterium]|nr:hypothetical protein [Thermodesulfovibrionales bacterium]